MRRGRAADDNCGVSFDVFFQRFENGDAADGGGAEATEILREFLRPSPEQPERIEHPDGSAEIDGLDDNGMMLTHIDDATGLWDLLVSAARAANWTIMPVGCPVCVFSSDMEAALPRELVDFGVVVITNGTDLLRVVAEAP